MRLWKLVNHQTFGNILFRPLGELRRSFFVAINKSDIPVNRLLKTALGHIAKLTDNPILQQQLLTVRQRFAGVGILLPHERAPKVEDLDRMQRRYAKVVSLAHRFLNGQYLDIRSGQQLVFSLLFDMNRLFERYTANRLRTQARRRGLRLIEQGPRRYLGEDDTGRGCLQMRPDICLLNRQNQVVAILDAKWKLLTANDRALASLSSADLYQVSTYASAYHCDQVMLLYPEQINFLTGQSLRLQLTQPVTLKLVPIPLQRKYKVDLTNKLLDKIQA